MAVVVTVQVQNGYRVAITVTGMVSPYVWTLERFDSVLSAYVPVRGPGWIGDTVVTDNEAQLNTGILIYRAVWYELVGSDLIRHETTGGVAPGLEGSLPVLGDPITGEYAECSIQSWPEWSRGERASTIEIPGADYPTTVSDRLGAATSQITLRTDDVGERFKVRALLQPGRTLLLRPACSGVDDESGYLHMRQVTSRRRSNNAGDPVRFWVLDVTHKTMPTPELAATGATLQDLYNAYPLPATLTDLETAFPGTLIDIAQADLA